MIINQYFAISEYARGMRRTPARSNVSVLEKPENENKDGQGVIKHDGNSGQK